MTWRRVLRLSLLSIAIVVGVAGVTIGSVWAYLHPHCDRTNGLVYGRRGANALYLDILKPTHPNGLGIAVMVSGGWKSGNPGSFRTWIAAPLLRHGYTVFPVYHISQPESTISELTADVNRGIRFIRLHAKEYGVDPSRLGVTGGSAGGHLSLMLATRGGPGVPTTADPVDRESSAVQAVAIFYPVTDLLDLGASTENPGDGGPPRSFVKGFGPEATNPPAWKILGRDLSPIYHVHSNMPPMLIYHGDADTLVPLDQSQRFQAEARKLGATVEIVVHHGGHHGWLTMPLDLRHFADWFDEHLRP